ncbi:glutaminase A [Myroides sp. LJL119]
MAANAFNGNLDWQKHKKITQRQAQEILDSNRSYISQGNVADYIPELAKINKQAISLSIVQPNGEIINVGDSDQKFTIQSISKIISLFVAVSEIGEQQVFNLVGYYGSDKPFNYSANLDFNGKPYNPMMNAGAILTTALIPGEGQQAYEKILKMIRFITNNPTIDINEKVYLSEKLTGHRNRSMFYMLVNSGYIDYTQENEDKLDNYFKQCSIEVTSEDLAKIGYFFANNCVRYDGDKTFENPDLAKLIQSVMFTSGMYEFSGEYARKVSLPSKSGVGGGIVVSANKGYGIGVFSPSLDKHGNSLAGYHIIKDLAKELDLSVF